jgi:uncharacterized membrane protein
MASVDIAAKVAEYFLQPKASGYDVWKTLTFAVVLAAAAYALYHALKRLGVRADARLAAAVAPYVLLGSAVRVLEDAAVLPDSFLFVTPMIYVLVFCATFGALLLSLLAQKTAAGLDPQAAAVVMLFFAPWALLFREAKWSAQNKVVALAHMFDATTTAVSMQFFGYSEQHVLPGAVIAAFGPFSFVPLKLVAVVAILMAIDRFAGKDAESREFASYLKLVIGILGAATGMRDFIALAAGV